MVTGPSGAPPAWALPFLRVVAQIPPGSVLSYSDVADLASRPGRARLAARALALAGEQVPWQRVLRSSGAIAFVPGSSAALEQAARLRAEGVDVRAGRVSLVRYRWHDAALGLVLDR